MIINWKKPQAGVLVIPVIKDEIIIKYLQLLPGNNQIEEADWELAKKNLQDKLDTGLIEEILEDGKKIKNIKQLSAKKAKEVIKNTFDLDTLQNWQEEEGRDEVRAILYNQTEEINSPTIKTQGDR